MSNVKSTTSSSDKNESLTETDTGISKTLAPTSEGKIDSPFETNAGIVKSSTPLAENNGAVDEGIGEFVKNPTESTSDGGKFCEMNVTTDVSVSSTDIPTSEISENSPENSDSSISLNNFYLSPEENDQWITENCKILFTLGCIKKYFLYPDGRVETSPNEETLKIIQLKGTVKLNDSELPKFFLCIDNWYYPLVPNISPYLKDQDGVFLFPDVKCKGVFVALIIPDETVESFDSAIRSILFPPEEAEDEHFPVYRTRRSIATGIVSGASYISSGLVKGAEKASDAIYYVTPQIVKRMNSKPLHINPSVSKSIEGATSFTQKTAFVTGYLATQVGRATAALGNYLAPHVHQKGVTLLNYAGVPSQQAEQRMTDVLEVVAGTAQGFSTIYEGLNKSSRLLASSLANNTVTIVAHRYGPEAGVLGSSTVNLMGDLYNTATNINLLTPKAALKTTLKETGKAIVGSDKT